MNIRKLPAIILTFAFCSFAQINLMSPDITFRDANTAGNTTYHYGDLSLSGGVNGMIWGWFTANRITNMGSFSNSGESYFSSDAWFYGSLNCYGTKNFIQPHPTDTTKAIKYIAIESGEALTLARGTAKTSYGTATIDLPEHFGLVTSDQAPITVLLTPKKVPALLYTKEESKTRIVVAMKDADLRDFGDAEFSWQVTGVRDGFENEAVIIDADPATKTDISTAVSPTRNKINERVAKMAEKRKTENRRK